MTPPVAAPQQECVCGLERRPEIWLCPHFRYYKGDRRYTSVSRVIETLMPFDKSKIDPDVLANATMRGRFIDRYFSEFLSGAPLVSTAEFREMVEPSFVQDKYKTAAEHAADAEQRLIRLLEWWAKWSSPSMAATPQVPLCDDENEVAVTADVRTSDLWIDLKCTSDLDAKYSLQLGSYMAMDSQKFPIRDAAILHVTKDRVRLVPYDTKLCKRRWTAGLAWFKAMKEMK